jgi:predicted acetyltransferase
MQVREFQKVKTLLFDGESSLRSPALQKEIKNKLQIKIHAEPYWKRSLAERAIGEIKIRMAIHLDFNGTASPPTPGNTPGNKKTLFPCCFFQD